MRLPFTINGTHSNPYYISLFSESGLPKVAVTTDAGHTLFFTSDFY